MIGPLDGAHWGWRLCDPATSSFGRAHGHSSVRLSEETTGEAVTMVPVKGGHPLGGSARMESRAWIPQIFGGQASRTW